MFGTDPQQSIGFGPSRLHTRSLPLSTHRLSADRRDSRKFVRRECPRLPGVYGMWDNEGELIYVGKSKRLRSRLLSYFAAKAPDEKPHRILSRAQTIGWEVANDEFAALLRELELIRRWRPRFNVQGQPGRASKAFICIGRSPAPYVHMAPRPGLRTLASFGPVSSGGKAREAVRRLNDWFALRDCPDQREMIFSDQLKLFPLDPQPACIRFEIGTCLGPCVGECSRPKYSARVRAAKAFLNGNTGAVLQELTTQMNAAALALQFERAAALRGILDTLQWLADHLDRLRQVSADYFFVYAAGHQRRNRWYLVQGGNIVRTVAAPRNSSTASAALRAVEEVFANKDALAAGSRPDDYSQVLLTAAWFRRNPAELEHTLTPFAAIERCRELLEGVARGAGAATSQSA